MTHSKVVINQTRTTVKSESQNRTLTKTLLQKQIIERGLQGPSGGGAGFFSFGPTPPLATNIGWVRTPDATFFIYDTSIGRWVSSTDVAYYFGADYSDNQFLKTATDSVPSVDSHYVIDRQARLEKIIANGHDVDKSFELLQNGFTVFSFSLLAGVFYGNADIDFNANDRVSVRSLSGGGKVRKANIYLFFREYELP